MAITLAELTRHVKNLNAIKKFDIDIDVEIRGSWAGTGYKYTLEPQYKNIATIPQLASICEAKNSFVSQKHLSGESSDTITQLYSTLANNNEYASVVTEKDQSVPNSPVKYFSEVNINNLSGVTTIRIIQPPLEQQVGDRTYRYFSWSNLGHHAAFCVNDQHPLYNYLDAGHIVVFLEGENHDDSYVFVTNQLSLDANYIIAMFSLHPDMFKNLLTEGVFLNYRDARTIALKMERQLPERHTETYNKVKDEIFKHYETNSSGLIVTKFQRGEINELEYANIKFTRDKASYAALNVEMDNLSEIVFSRMDINNEHNDIYTVVQIACEHIIEQIAKSPINSEGTAFKESHTWNIRINDIPIAVSISNTSTRRRINNVLINNAEIMRVIQRATCFDNEELYNAFVKQVGELTLEARDILANGLPVKVAKLSNKDDKDPNKYPKLFFQKDKEGNFYMFLDREKKEKVGIKRFIGFIREVNALSSKVNGGSGYENGSYVFRDIEWARRRLKELVDVFTTTEKKVKNAETGVVTVERTQHTTETQRENLIEESLLERSEAEKRSMQLLKDVITKTGAEEMNFKGQNGYKVKGNLRNYFVEKATNRVYNADTGAYVCIVNGRHEIGVGYDALVARLLALKNDSVVAKHIHTL